MSRPPLGAAGRALLAAALSLAAAPAAAQLQFAGDAPRIYTIEPRDHLFKHELNLGAGILPLDAFYTGVVLAGAYTFHASDVWGWEALHAMYAIDIDTPLKQQLEGLSAQPSVRDNRRVHFLVSTNAVFRPLYGKLALFNRGIVQAQTALIAGVGAVNSNSDTRLALDVGAAIHLWASRSLAVRIDVRDYLAFDATGPSNVLMFGLAASFNFTVRLAEASDSNPVASARRAP